MIVTKPYDREKAVIYARRWALSRNPLFYDFAGQGGDCTDFASQVLLAGSCTMDYTRDFGWYYLSVGDRSPSWTGVEYFYDFLTGRPDFAAENGGIGPFGRDVPVEEVFEGDFIQLADRNGDFYHTLVITGFEPDDIIVCAHTNDALDRRLSTYNYAFLRFIHIDGIHTEIPDDTCFDALLAGKAIDVNPPPEDFLSDRRPQ
ncbi:MAG: amidase domain-containing protein [Clostridia bacterium]|nr:amidase domain-containing protein [Clostridia bacterium]